MSRKKTNDQFIKEVFDLVGDEYEFLEDYNGTDYRLLVRHNVCGNEYKVRPANFLRGKRCRICVAIAKGKSQRKTHETFSEEVYSLVGNDYSILGEYMLSNEKVRFKHNLCGHEFEMLPNNFLNHNQRCPKCGELSRIKTQTRTHTEFCEEVFALVGNEYTVIGEYELSEKPVLIRHNVCGYTYSVRAGNFINNNRRCPECAKISSALKRRVPASEFKEKLYDLYEDEYVVLEFTGMKRKTLVRHSICEKTHWYDPYGLLNGTTCVYCGKMWSKTNNYFLNEVEQLVGQEYTVLSEYLGANTYVTMKHNKCGHQYNVQPANFLFGRRCPQCMESTGERKIREFLDQLELKYLQEYSFEDCKSIKPLRFDFAILGNDEDIECLVEYDGEHHFEPVDFANKGEAFAEDLHSKTKKRDNIKNQYCKENEIPLLRIPYWDFDNIEKILGDFILNN